MKKEKLIVGALCLSVLLSSLTVQGAEEASSAEATSEGAAAQEGTDLASMKWSDYAISINGNVLTFPTTFDALAPLGLENDDDPAATEIEPNSYGNLYFKLGKGRISVEFTNLDINVLPADQVVVTGISLDDSFLEDEPVEIELPGGIKFGESTREDIENAYGKPSDVYEGDMYAELTYEQDIYNSVELSVDNETGKLNAIDIENIKEPEGMEKGEVNTDVPEAVAAYTLPDKLSDDLNAYEIEVEGTAYKLPVPVSVMIEDGWEVVADDTEEVIAAQNSGWVTLSKNNQTIRDLVRNHENYATIPENCWLGCITLGVNDANLEGSLPGGIQVGMTAEEFEKILTDNGVEFEKDDSSDSYVYYNYGEAYDQTHEVVVYSGEDDYYPKDTIIKISVENTEIE